MSRPTTQKVSKLPMIDSRKEQCLRESARLKRFWDRYQDRIRAEGREITQAEFAETYLGTTQGNFSHLLYGRQPIPLETLFDLALLLDFDPREVRPEIQEFIDKVFRAVKGSEQNLIESYLSQLPPAVLDQVLVFARFLAEQKSSRPG